MTFSVSNFWLFTFLQFSCASSNLLRWDMSSLNVHFFVSRSLAWDLKSSSTLKLRWGSTQRLRKRCSPTERFPARLGAWLKRFRKLSFELWTFSRSVHVHPRLRSLRSWFVSATAIVPWCASLYSMAVAVSVSSVRLPQREHVARTGGSGRSYWSTWIRSRRTVRRLARVSVT